MILRRLFAGPPSAKSKPVLDGVPCRAYRVGEHAGALSRMLLWRLVISAVVAALVSAVVPLVVVLVILGVETPPSPSDVPEAVRWLSWPIGFGLVFLVLDYLLIRGRLAGAISLLTWAGKKDAAELRTATGITRPTDRAAAARWLKEHPDASEDAPAVRGWRAHLQILAGDYEGAEATITSLPRGRPEEELGADALRAQRALAQGLPFDLGDLRTQVAALQNPESRARMAAEVGALAAQARFTCDGGDHLEPLGWARQFVGRRDRMTLITGYWLPIVVLVVLSSAALTFILPPAQ